MDIGQITDTLYKPNNAITITPIGIGGFKADVRLNETLDFTSDVPDNYVEDGSTIHDHIINNPITLNIEGEVSDIHQKIDFLPELVVKALDKASNLVSNLYPFKKTSQASSKIDKVLDPVNKAYSKLNDVYQAGGQMYDMIMQRAYGQRARTRQDDFFDFLTRIYYSKQLIDIETHFKTYKNMRILSLSIIRDNTTDQALKYKITAKEIRFAKTIYVDKDKYFQKNPSASMKGKVKDKTNKGVVEGKKVDKSFLYTVFGG